MRDPKPVTSHFFTINEEVVKQKNDLISKFPNLKKYNYHLGLFREGLIIDAITIALKSEKLLMGKQFEITTGFIVGEDGESLSKQIDILVYDASPPYASYKYGMFEIVNLKQVIAVIEVKSVLNKESIIGKNGSLANIKSVRDLESANQTNVFSAILGFSAAGSWEKYAEFIRSYFIPEFAYLNKANYEASVKMITPDMIVSLDSLIIYFGRNADLESMIYRPAIFKLEPKIKKYTPIQILYFELLKHILQKFKIKDEEQILSDLLNFSEEEKKNGFANDNPLGINWHTPVFID